MFARTINGLSTQHQFYDAELVVYCEGKIEEEGEASSSDSVFWSQIFAESGKKVHCKSLGSKNTLLNLANYIISNSVDNVVVTMDRDYDHIRDTLISHPQVIYSYGYSWESDVILDFNFKIALGLFVTTNKHHQIETDLKIYLNKQSEYLRRVFALDYKYIGHHGKLFDRDKPQSIINTNKSSEPNVNIKTILDNAKALGRFQTRHLPKETYRSACGIQFFFGKVVSRLVYHWFVFRTRDISDVRKSQYSTFMNQITVSLDISDKTLPRNSYYAQCIGQI